MVDHSPHRHRPSSLSTTTAAPVHTRRNPDRQCKQASVLAKLSTLSLDVPVSHSVSRRDTNASKGGDNPAARKPRSESSEETRHGLVSRISADYPQTPHHESRQAPGYTTTSKTLSYQSDPDSPVYAGDRRRSFGGDSRHGHERFQVPDTVGRHVRPTPSTPSPSRLLPQPSTLRTDCQRRHNTPPTPPRRVRPSVSPNLTPPGRRQGSPSPLDTRSQQRHIRPVTPPLRSRHYSSAHSHQTSPPQRSVDRHRSPNNKSPMGNVRSVDRHHSPNTKSPMGGVFSSPNYYDSLSDSCCTPPQSRSSRRRTSHPRPKWTQKSDSSPDTHYRLANGHKRHTQSSHSRPRRLEHHDRQPYHSPSPERDGQRSRSVHSRPHRVDHNDRQPYHSSSSAHRSRPRRVEHHDRQPYHSSSPDHDNHRSTPVDSSPHRLDHNVRRPYRSSSTVATPDHTRHPQRTDRDAIAYPASRPSKDISNAFALSRNVTANMTSLTSNNYDPWQKQWTSSSRHLGWHPTWNGTDQRTYTYNVLTESKEERNTRMDAAMMLCQTIGEQHTDWLRGTDKQNPQAIFRRLNTLFYGTNMLASQMKLNALLNQSSMASTRTSLCKFGCLMREIYQKMKTVGNPPSEKLVVGIYLMGLLEEFDPIHFKLQDAVSEHTTLESVITETENWVGGLGIDRSRELFALVRGNDRLNITTLLSQSSLASFAPIASTPNSVTVPNKKEICRIFRDTGKCRYGDNCKHEHVKQEHVKVKDYSQTICNTCQVKGHSENYGGCPGKLDRRNSQRLSRLHRDSAGKVEDTILKTLQTQVSELQAAHKALQDSQVPSIPDDASDFIFNKQC
jgi:hypothetical protein